jgi:hypothetical protein
MGLNLKIPVDRIRRTPDQITVHLPLQPQPYGVIKPPIPVLDRLPGADRQYLSALGQRIQSLAYDISWLSLSLSAHGRDEGTHGIQTAADNLAGREYFDRKFIDLQVSRVINAMARRLIGLITHGH